MCWSTAVFLVAAAWAADPQPAPPASASELHPGLVSPSAVRMDAGSGYLVAAAAGYSGFGAGVAGSVRGAYAPTDELALSAGVFGGSGLGLWQVGARTNMVSTDGIAVAPIATVFGNVDTTYARTISGATAAFGLAAEGGFDRVRVDAALPMFGLRFQPWRAAGERVATMPAFALLDVGLTFEAGPQNRGRVRFGYGAGLGMLTVRHLGDAWLGEVAVAFDDTTVATQIGFGRRF